jgi:hypothetical protein
LGFDRVSTISDVDKKSFQGLLFPVISLPVYQVNPSQDRSGVIRPEPVPAEPTAPVGIILQDPQAGPDHWPTLFLSPGQFFYGEIPGISGQKNPEE